MNSLPFVPLADGLLGGLGIGAGVTGMTSGTLGAAGTPATGGLTGLFNALVGSAEGEAGVPLDPAALIAALGQSKTGLELGMEAVPVTQVLPLGEGVELEIIGAQVDVAVLQQRIVEITLQLEQAGIDLESLGGAADYAKALVALGMEPEEAAAKASALETMMNLLKNKLHLEGEEGEEAVAGLTALLLAGTVQPLPLGQSLTVTIRHESETVQMVNVSLLQAKLAAAAQMQGGDVARALVQGEAKVMHKEVAKDDKAEVEVADVAVEAAVDAAAPVASVPQLPAVETPKVADVNVETLGQAVASVAAPTVQAVTRENVLAKLDEANNEILFKVKEGRDGVVTVEATPASSKVLEQQLQAVGSETAQVTVRHGNPEKVSAPVHAAWPFAEQAALAAKSRVGDQAVVQIKGLLEQGGGQVRMQLNPGSLGEIRIELTVRNGEVSGTIAASDVAVVHELVRDMQSLKQGLADAGLKFAQEGVNVALSQHNQQGFGGQQHAQQGHNQGSHRGGGDGAGEGDAGLVAEAAAVTGWVRPDALVDVNV